MRQSEILQKLIFPLLSLRPRRREDGERQVLLGLRAVPLGDELLAGLGNFDRQFYLAAISLF